MSYIPPRGPCGYKAGLLTPACPCLRFMIHPVKAPTSFECDGCSHHASFHQMQMKLEEELATRWTNKGGTFDSEAFEEDQEVQGLLARNRDLIASGDSTYDLRETVKPRATRKNVAAQPAKKRPRSGR